MVRKLYFLVRVVLYIKSVASQPDGDEGFHMWQVYGLDPALSPYSFDALATRPDDSVWIAEILTNT